jgi:hypothetical protein
MHSNTSVSEIDNINDMEVVVATADIEQVVPVLSRLKKRRIMYKDEKCKSDRN